MITKKILIIDDNRDMLKAFCQILPEHGYDVTLADSIDAALEECLALKFNIVICDIKFPKKSGYDFLKAFRETCDIPVLAISASTLKEDRESAIAAGFNGFLSKPISVEHIIAAIETALAEADARAANKWPGYSPK